MKISSISSFNKDTLQQKNIKLKSNNLIFSGGIKFNKVKTNDVVGIFEELAKIPSPPLKEINVANWILSFCKQNKLRALFDNYKNVILKIPATDKTKKPLLFSAHMDVVGDDSPISIVKEGNFIKTDGKRTLGADDKAGVASALLLAKEIASSNSKHGGLEVIFTRDEELGMTGIMNAAFNDINSKYVFVLDEAKLGKFDDSGAGYTTATLSMTTPYGGHSGIDINDEYRLNAAKMISELISEIPQGVYYKDENGPITSINIGTIIAGDIQNSAAKIVEEKLISDNYLEFFMKNSVTNVINTKAMATLSIRSSDKECENNLRKKLIEIVDNFNKKYENLVSVNIGFEELMPIFEKTEDKTLKKVYKEACKTIGLTPEIGTFPAGAETHIYMNKKNKNGEIFSPALLGVADIFNMHSSSEKIDFLSLKKGYELIREIFFKFNTMQ